VSPSNLLRPLMTLRESRTLLLLSTVGTCYAVGQGVWFAFLVTYGVSNLKLSLSAAGLLFAVMQATGIGGRMLLGFAADRLGSATLALALVGVTSAASSLVLVFADASWPFWVLLLISGVAGVTVSSWNGMQLAEIARLAPRTRVSEALAGSTIVIFIGYVFGPAVFALIVALTGYPTGFLCVALTTIAALIPLARLSRSPSGSAGS
jgi:MFS family permease